MTTTLITRGDVDGVVEGVAVAATPFDAVLSTVSGDFFVGKTYHVRPDAMPDVGDEVSEDKPKTGEPCSASNPCSFADASPLATQGDEIRMLIGDYVLYKSVHVSGGVQVSGGWTRVEKDGVAHFRKHFSPFLLPHWTRVVRNGVNPDSLDGFPVVAAFVSRQAGRGSKPLVLSNLEIVLDDVPAAPAGNAMGTSVVGVYVSGTNVELVRVKVFVRGGGQGGMGTPGEPGVNHITPCDPNLTLPPSNHNGAPAPTPQDPRDGGTQGQAPGNACRGARTYGGLASGHPGAHPNGDGAGGSDGHNNGFTAVYGVGTPLPSVYFGAAGGPGFGGNGPPPRSIASWKHCRRWGGCHHHCTWSSARAMRCGGSGGGGGQGGAPGGMALGVYAIDATVGLTDSELVIGQGGPGGRGGHGGIGEAVHGIDGAGSGGTGGKGGSGAIGLRQDVLLAGAGKAPVGGPGSMFTATSLDFLEWGVILSNATTIGTETVAVGNTVAVHIPRSGKSLEAVALQFSLHTDSTPVHLVWTEEADHAVLILVPQAPGWIVLAAGQSNAPLYLGAVVSADDAQPKVVPITVAVSNAFAVGGAYRAATDQAVALECPHEEVTFLLVNPSTNIGGQSPPCVLTSHGGSLASLHSSGGQDASCRVLIQDRQTGTRGTVVDVAFTGVDELTWSVMGGLSPGHQVDTDTSVTFRITAFSNGVPVPGRPDMIQVSSRLSGQLQAHTVLDVFSSSIPTLVVTLSLSSVGQDSLTFSYAGVAEGTVPVTVTPGAPKSFECSFPAGNPSLLAGRETVSVLCLCLDRADNLTPCTGAFADLSVERKNGPYETLLVEKTGNATAESGTEYVISANPDQEEGGLFEVWAKSPSKIFFDYVVGVVTLLVSCGQRTENAAPETLFGPCVSCNATSFRYDASDPASSCTSCPLYSHISGDKSENVDVSAHDCKCMPGYHDVSERGALSECVPCTDGMMCPGGELAQCKPGYYQQGSFSQIACFPCEVQAACLGTGEGVAGCAKGQTGFRCSECATGYFPAGNQNQLCSACFTQTEAWWVVVAFVVVWTAGSVGMYVAIRLRVTGEVPLNFLVVLPWIFSVGLLLAVADKLPEPASSIVKMFGSRLSARQMECFLPPDLAFYVTTMGVLVLVVYTVAVFFLAEGTWRGCRSLRQGRRPQYSARDAETGWAVPAHDFAPSEGIDLGVLGEISEYSSCDAEAGRAGRAHDFSPSDGIDLGVLGEISEYSACDAEAGRAGRAHVFVLGEISDESSLSESDGGSSDGGGPSKCPPGNSDDDKTVLSSEESSRDSFVNDQKVLDSPRWSGMSLSEQASEQEQEEEDESVMETKLPVEETDEEVDRILDEMAWPEGPEDPSPATRATIMFLAASVVFVLSASLSLLVCEHDSNEDGNGHLYLVRSNRRAKCEGAMFYTAASLAALALVVVPSLLGYFGYVTLYAYRNNPLARRARLGEFDYRLRHTGSLLVRGWALVPLLRTILLSLFVSLLSEPGLLSVLTGATTLIYVLLLALTRPYVNKMLMVFDASAALSLVCLVVFVGREAESSGAAEAGVASLVLLGLVVLLALGADCANPVISRLLASFRQEILYISLKHQQQMERLGRDGDGDLDGDASSSLFGTLCLSGGLPVSDVECEPAEQGPLKIMTTIPKISGFVDVFTTPEVPWVMDSNGCPDSWIVFVEHVAEMLDRFLVGECPQPFTMSIDPIGFVLNSDLSDKTQSAVDLLNSLHLAPLPSRSWNLFCGGDLGKSAGKEEVEGQIGPFSHPVDTDSSESDTGTDVDSPEAKDSVAAPTPEPTTTPTYTSTPNSSQRRMDLSGGGPDVGAVFVSLLAVWGERWNSEYDGKTFPSSSVQKYMEKLLWEEIIPYLPRCGRDKITTTKRS